MMYISFQPDKARFSRSSHPFVNYLEKENKDPDLPHEFFFNQDRKDILPEEVSRSIDHNTKGIKKHHPKFYLINVCPSDRELRHIESDKDKMRLYIRELMKDYVNSFNREIFGRPVQVKDVLYFAKIEVRPRFKYSDMEVKQNGPFLREIRQLKKKIREAGNKNQGLLLERELRSVYAKIPHKINGKAIKKGTEKPGRRTHVHLIVSRKDATNSYSLSPGSKYRASNVVMHGKLVKRGFDRNRFFEAGEKTFDRLFTFNRNYADSYAARKAYLKNPKVYFEQLKQLPPAEQKIAYGFLKRTHVQTPVVTRSQLKFALKKIRKALDIGVASSSIEY